MQKFSNRDSEDEGYPMVTHPFINGLTQFDELSFAAGRIEELHACTEHSEHLDVVA